jgi:arylsulfate sulfotransferase
VTYDPKDDAILVSVRCQDAVIKFSRSTGELTWILGDHGNWGPPWSDKLLTPQGELEWQYHQHNVTVTRDGGVMAFDNGSSRAVPFENARPAPENFSRAVEFLVDENSMTVEQAWQFDAGRSTDYYSTFVGGATLLPQTGNVFVTFGGVTYEDDGTPSDNNQAHRVMARHVEVTRDAAAEKVLELRIEDRAETDPIRFFSFRGEHVKDLYAE